MWLYVPLLTERVEERDTYTHRSKKHTNATDNGNFVFVQTNRITAVQRPALDAKTKRKTIKAPKKK